MNIAIITLGCSKNQVDSEMLLGYFKNRGFNLVTDLNIADVILVNTCGFIESAKQEAINTILDAADYKEIGVCKSLIVTGCLAKRYKKEIIENMPEVDLVIGVDEYKNIDEILSKFLSQNFLTHKLSFNERIISSNFPLAYIRISDGCDNRCNYCAIPLIRGRFKSRKIEDILEEVENLAKQGIQEFCIISQDTSKYGLDIYGELKLAELLNKIGKIPGVKWIRVLYMYLYEINDALIEEFKNNDKLCKYFDIPVQHFSDKMLKAMNRYDNKELIYKNIEKIRKNVPNTILRTTLIAGFPGETEEDFEILRQGLLDIKFDRVGAFAFSREEDTVAYDMDNQVPEEIKQERLKEIFEIQKPISLELNKAKVGNEYEVIVEDVTENDEYFICRSYMEAPDVDGRIYIKIDEESANKVIVGEFCKVKIVDYNEYDLFAKVI